MKGKVIVKNNSNDKINIQKNKEDKYHHGDLKESLIKSGLKLLVEEGVKGFSLRKIAAMCNVSHAAPYKHFKSKEELINAISSFVYKKFEDSLSDVRDEDPYERIIELGKRYVLFMTENYDCLRYLFLNNSNGDNSVVIKDGCIQENNYKAFNIFRKAAEECLEYRNVVKEKYAQDIIAMWSIVHGLAIMIGNNTFIYKGDYMELVENILRQNLKL